MLFSFRIRLKVLALAMQRSKQLYKSRSALSICVCVYFHKTRLHQKVFVFLRISVLAKIVKMFCGNITCFDRIHFNSSVPIVQTTIGDTFDTDVLRPLLVTPAQIAE